MNIPRGEKLMHTRSEASNGTGSLIHALDIALRKMNYRISLDKVLEILIDMEVLKEPRLSRVRCDHLGVRKIHFKLRHM